MITKFIAVAIFLAACPALISQAQTTTPADKPTTVEEAIEAQNRKADIIFNKIDSGHVKIEAKVEKLPEAHVKKEPVKVKVKYVYISTTDTVYIRIDTCKTVAPIIVYRNIVPPPIPVKSKFRLFKKRRPVLPVVDSAAGNTDFLPVNIP